MKSKFVLTVFGFVVWNYYIASACASNYVCEDVGRFQLPGGGNGYVDCVKDAKGDLILYKEVNCGGFPYSNSLRNCDFKHPTQLDYFEIIDVFDLERNDSYDDYCVDNTMPNLCFSCNRKVQCIGADAYVEFCDDGETCVEDANFGGGVCLPYDISVTMSSACDCTRFGFTDDGYNKECYLFCDTTTVPPTIDFYECPEGQIFEDGVCKRGVIEGCYTPAPPMPVCTEMGTFLDESECSYYYVCIPDGSGGFEVRQYCCKNPTTFFDIETGLCENVCNLLDGSGGEPFICPGVGQFMDPHNCNIYYVCLTAGQPPYDENACPDGTYFHEDVHSCQPGIPDNCVASGFNYYDCPRVGEVADIAGCTIMTTLLYEELKRDLY